MTTRIKFSGGSGTAFFREVRAQVQTYFQWTGTSPYADHRLWTKAALFAGIGALSYAALLTLPLPPAALLALAVIFGLSGLLLGINVAHDAAHDALTPHPRLNRAVQAAIFCLIGVDGRLWRLRHTKSHHVFPNVNGCDADIDHNGLIRLSPNHPRRWFHGLQHLYAPLLYLLVNLHSIFVQDFVYLAKDRLANMVGLRPTRSELLRFLACKTVYFTLTLGLPLLLIDLPWWQIVVGYLIVTAVTSLAFVVLLIGTHFAEETSFPEVGPDGRLTGDWAAHAVVTALDWSPGSRLAAFLTGGANTHVAHHLFPKVSHVHYRELAPIIRATARKHGLVIRETSFLGMLRSHLRFLRRLGRAQPADAPA